MKIYIARHGRTNYNDLGLCNADPSIDVHLTTVGKQQAQVLASQLKKARINHIFISELRRTKQTADQINKFHNVALKIDPRLNDIRTGFEGSPCEEYIAALDSAPNRWTARFNDGESIEDLKMRTAEFLASIKTKDHSNVLIVTSQWVAYTIIAILDRLSNEQAWDLEMAQGSFVVREW